ncbi:hypothetical protein [Pseudonocardia sp. 73-21]|uniref:hypothetical protein n=1 Tax=Pseudonocardia sp. 73-21 TaxID=1895809 RepID=UPI00261E9162|nr:hypothetical protein [Pseudonocardia sp. 73-21]
MDRGDEVPGGTVVTEGAGGETPDASGCVVTPGLVNVLHRLLQTAFRTLSKERIFVPPALPAAAIVVTSGYVTESHMIIGGNLSSGAGAPSGRQESHVPVIRGRHAYSITSTAAAPGVRAS